MTESSYTQSVGLDAHKNFLAVACAPAVPRRQHHFLLAALTARLGLSGGSRSNAP
jgi:hypothetical protein